MTIDTWTTNHLRAYLHDRNPTNIDDADLAEKVIAWLESLPEDDASYWIHCGWSRCIDKCLNL